MRVFVAGATGALGRPLLRRLVAAGHEVVGLTRAPEKAPLLAALGAEPSIADARDAPALRAAVLSARPHAVVDLLTALAGHALRRASDLADTNALRVEATRTLLDAASGAGARRFVAASMVLAYGYGDHGDGPLAEDAPAGPRAADAEAQAVVDALRALEDQVRAASAAWRVEGAVLRLGLLYGPGAWDASVSALRRRALPLPGGGARGALPLVHVEDAAEAVTRALERATPGAVYNVAEDGAAPLGAWYAALARAAGAPRPRALPRWLARRVAPYRAVLFDTRLAVSSARARRELGWSPRFSALRDGPAELGGAGAEAASSR